MTLKNDSKSAEPVKGKSKYEPPKITYTEIETEEALMGFCKTSGSGGIPTGCSLPCSNPGS
ncbi:MAG: hypothetical protein JXR91_15835 [Deltaproteobacteria bacterium]|nr:hypothetical protein [Deltaproteobacteria bacterium]